MLESPSLLLRPWTPVPGDGDERRLPRSWARAILDAATHAALGSASWRTRPAPALLRWLVRPVVEVFETEDQSLLCTLRGPWGPASSWQVRDAEGRSVGTVHRSALLDPFGRCLAVIEPAAEGGARFRSPNGRPRGMLEVAPEGARLTFADELDGDPFARMLLLAAALINGEQFDPRRSP